MEETGSNFSPGFTEYSKVLEEEPPVQVLTDYHMSQAMNANMNCFQPIRVEPPHFNQLPVLDHIENEWEFNMELNSESASKSSWMYSSKLNKVFVKINTYLNVHPVFRVIDPSQMLYIRAMIVYSSTSELADPVKKCPNHRSQPNQDNPEHILRCEVKETKYVGKETGKLFKDKLAILIPLNSIASNEALKLLFTCQNSCSGGMNRKMTCIVFTLENEDEEILGRHKMNFKVCSCPKRDKDKDEESMMKTLPKKRKGDALPSTSKKVAIQAPVVKQESDTAMSTEVLTPLPSDLQSLNSGLLELKREPQCCDLNIALPSPEIKLMALQSVYNIVAGEMVRTGDAVYQRYLNDIQKQIGK